MKFSNKNGDYLQIDIENYEFPELDPWEYEENDANWLDIHIRAKDAKYQWDAIAPCLLTWEAENLLYFLGEAIEGATEPRVYFESGNLHFQARQREDGICILRCGLWLDLHPYDDSDLLEPYYLEFPIDRDDLAKEATDFAVQLAAYPKR
ncbi:MAG: hypothetical protein RR396_02595 [Clostridiales bacterium]